MHRLSARVHLLPGWQPGAVRQLPLSPKISRGPLVMNRNDIYIDLRGQPIPLATLDDEEIDLATAATSCRNPSGLDRLRRVLLPGIVATVRRARGAAKPGTSHCALSSFT